MSTKKIPEMGGIQGAEPDVGWDRMGWDGLPGGLASADFSCTASHAGRCAKLAGARFCRGMGVPPSCAGRMRMVGNDGKCAGKVVPGQSRRDRGKKRRDGFIAAHHHTWLPVPLRSFFFFLSQKSISYVLRASTSPGAKTLTPLGHGSEPGPISRRRQKRLAS